MELIIAKIAILKKLIALLTLSVSLLYPLGAVDVVEKTKIRFEHGYKLEETQKRNDGLFHGTARVSPAPIYYKKNGVYVSLQSGFVDRNGIYEMADAPINVQIPKTFQGSHRITADNGESWYANPMNANVSQGQLVDIGADWEGNRQNKLVFLNAFTGVDVEIVPFWGGYETFYTFKDPTKTFVEYDLQPEGDTLILHGNKALDVQKTGKSVGFINEATAKDKNGKDIAVQMTSVTKGAGKKIRYEISATADKFPVILDPLVRICSTSITGPCQQIITIDGAITRFTAMGTWAAIRDAANATNIYPTLADSDGALNSLLCTDNNAGGTQVDALSRIVLQFDTGSVGATSFSSSSLVMRQTGTISTNSGVGIKYAPSGFNSSSTNALITTDWQNASNTRAADLKNFTTTGVVQYDSFLLYATQTVNILNGGATPTTTAKIMLRCDNDFDNIQNTVGNATNDSWFSYSETANTTDSPQLIADYSVAAVTASDVNSSETNWFMLFSQIKKSLAEFFYQAAYAYIPL